MPKMSKEAVRKLLFLISITSATCGFAVACYGSPTVFSPVEPPPASSSVPVGR